MPRDERQAADGDQQWRGVAPRLDPTSLPEGMASEARNMRFRHGVAETRKGVYKPPWANALTPEIDNKVRPFGEIHGVGVFRNANNLEFIVIAADNKAYYTRQNNNPASLALPTQDIASGTGNTALLADCVKLTGDVTFTTAFNKIIMWRGKEFAPLVMSSENDGFEDMIQQWDSTKADYEEDEEVAFGPMIDIAPTSATTLVGGIDDSQDSLVLPSTTGYPISGVVTIDSEDIRYAGISGTTLTGCSRGYNSTSPALHLDGADVDVVGDGITHDGSTATVTTDTEHGYVTGADVTISGATETEFNGRVSITVTSTTSFTYTVTSSNAFSAGTKKCTNNRDYYEVATGRAPGAGDSPDTVAADWTQINTVMPNSTHGVFIANRLAAPTTYDSSTGSFSYGRKRDFVAVSDSLDEKHTFFNQIFRPNFGSADEILDLIVYDENRLLVLKSQTVLMITGFIVNATNTGTDSLASSVSIQPVINNYGVVGRGAAVPVGSDVYFYSSRRGILSMAQTDEAKVKGVGLPLSEPIQPLIDRIDVRYESAIRLAYYDSKLFAAVPLDNGEDGNNALLIYDFLSESWSGYDSGTAIVPKEFFTATYNNAQRLYFVGTDGFISVMEENWVGDDVADLTETDGLAQEDITSYLLTRGYHQNDIDHRNFRAASVGISTWNPKYTIAARTDGVGETQTLVSDRTKDRLAYYRPFDAARWVRNNHADDYSTPYREDYSVPLDLDRGRLDTEDAFGLLMEDEEGILGEDGLGGFSLGSGVDFSKMQETLEPFALTPRTGRFTQLEITNTQGRIKINQAVVTNSTGDRIINVKS